MKASAKKLRAESHGGILSHLINPMLESIPFPVIAVFHHRLRLAALVVLLALAGMLLSAVGEASSHGVAEMAVDPSMVHDEQPHGHEAVDGKSASHVHHDGNNHSHESLDHPIIRFVSGMWMSQRHSSQFAKDFPRSFRYRLERPPKVA